MKRGLLSLCCVLMLTSLVGCSNPSSSAVQTRNDLSREHLTGLSSGMKRNDVEDLIGKNDEALASKEDFDVYTLADGTTAVLRYQGDVLRSAFIRGKDNFEEALFNDFEKPATGNDTKNGNNNNVNDNINTNTRNTNNNTNMTNNNSNTTNTSESNTAPGNNSVNNSETINESNRNR